MPNPIPSDAGCYLDEYDAERFWSRVDFLGGIDHVSDPLSTAEGECWTWRGALTEAQYGRFRVFGRWVAAHRVAYRDFGARLPDDLDIDHLCRNHSCVRPSHLEAVTAQVNMSRGINAMKSHCKNGHEFTESNTLRSGLRRLCATCRREWGQKYYQQRKAAV